MRRYYYDDPLAAGWQCVRHGMKFENDNPSIGLDWLSGKVLYYGERYYIHPDSLHLLEPQKDDGIEFESDTEQYLYFWGAGHGLNELEKIIQRNGIPFHWPKSEASHA